jgi:hypothetical protein
VFNTDKLSSIALFSSKKDSTVMPVSSAPDTSLLLLGGAYAMLRRLLTLLVMLCKFRTHRL